MQQQKQRPTTATSSAVEQLAINTIRTLAMDAVEAAKCGHPGTPMALAPVAYSLWNEVLRYDPADPLWPNRDRFVLSCGHASMLLYAMLHLTGVEQVSEGKKTGEPAVSLDDIRSFRQLGSRCPGHPEHFETTGVETTTGPLGQGIGNSVGMAIAERWLAANFNRPGYDLFSYNIYSMCSDGDLMEGVGGEAASLAGHLKLSNLCWIYDDNHITIEGNTSLAFSEDVAIRFTGLGWHVVRVADANDLEALRGAYQSFLKTSDRPTLIIVRSHIAYGAPNKHDTAEAHGSPLGAEEVRLAKQAYGWPEDAYFLVPDEVPEHFAAGIGARGRKLSTQWRKKFEEYSSKFPEEARRWQQMESRELPKGWDDGIPQFPADAKGVASRISSGKVLNTIAQRVPWLIGGSADLAPSTMTLLTFDDGKGDFEAGNYAARNLHFGVREHAMASALNGMSLSYVRPYGATFFVFSDYLRPAMRLGAIMQLPTILIFTHDSIGLGEDGPTHQPIEHLAAARAIPNLITIRPGDANEVAEAWRVIMPLVNRPVALVLTRQNLPTLDRSKYAPASGTARGAYVLADSGGTPQVIIMATGSEVSVCVEAYEKLREQGVAARVVSMPSWELFEQQDRAYRDEVLPPAVTARIAVEAAIQLGWDRYLGPGGKFIGMNCYGASAPGSVLFKHFGITVEHIVSEARSLL